MDKLLTPKWGIGRSRAEKTSLLPDEHDNTVRVYRSSPGEIMLQLRAHGKTCSYQTCRNSKITTSQHTSAHLSADETKELIGMLQEALDSIPNYT
jgi:hypothetical protein